MRTSEIVWNRRKSIRTTATIYKWCWRSMDALATSNSAKVERGKLMQGPANFILGLLSGGHSSQAATVNNKPRSKSVPWAREVSSGEVAITVWRIGWGKGATDWESSQFGRGPRACAGQKLCKRTAVDTFWDVILGSKNSPGYDMEIVSGIVEGVGVDNVGVQPAWIEHNLGTPFQKGEQVRVRFKRLER